MRRNPELTDDEYNERIERAAQRQQLNSDQREREEPRPALAPVNDLGPAPSYTAEEQDFLRRNPGDEARMAQALGNDTGDRRFDSQSDNYDQSTNELSAKGRAALGQASTASLVAQNAYTQYLSGGTGPAAPVSTTMPVRQEPDPMPVRQEPDPMLARLAAQLEADRARQETERAEMRAMVMSQLGQATAPVDANSPGLKPIIDAQKLSLQRGSQRQRSAAVERAGVRGLGDSGALDTRINQIEQGRGESEAGMIGQILNSELQNKRAQVTQLLSLAVQSGDSEAARTLQGRLAAIDQEMTQNRFGQDLGFRNRALDTGDAFNRDDLDFRRYAFDEGQDANRYAFDNDLAYRLAQLQLAGNQGSMGFLGGLL